MWVVNWFKTVLFLFNHYRYNEIKDYKFNNPRFSGKTGHFTQVSVSLANSFLAIVSVAPKVNKNVTFHSFFIIWKVTSIVSPLKFHAHKHDKIIIFILEVTYFPWTPQNFLRNLIFSHIYCWKAAFEKEMFCRSLICFV